MKSVKPAQLVSALTLLLLVGCGTPMSKGYLHVKSFHSLDAPPNPETLIIYAADESGNQGPEAQYFQEIISRRLCTRYTIVTNTAEAQLGLVCRYGQGRLETFYTQHSDFFWVPGKFAVFGSHTVPHHPSYYYLTATLENVHAALSGINKPLYQATFTFGSEDPPQPTPAIAFLITKLFDDDWPGPKVRDETVKTHIPKELAK